MEGNILCASFNNDGTRVCIGTRTGFIVYGLDDNTVKFRSDYGGCGVVEILDNTKLVVVAGSDDSPNNPSRRIQTWNISPNHQKVITQETYHTPVLAVKITKNNIVVVRETMIHILNTSYCKEVATLRTESNPNGVCSLVTLGNDVDYIAFPPAGSKSSIEIYDLHAMQQKRVFKDLHSSPIRLAKFSHDGQLIATVSDSGTWIRVASVEGDRYWHLKRGNQYTTIDALAFSHDSSMICCSSANGTIHLWQLRDCDATPYPSVPASTKMFSMFTTSTKIYRMDVGERCIAISFSRDSSRIYMVSNTGKLYFLQIDGGKLEKRIDLLRPSKFGGIRPPSDDSEDDTVDG